MRRQQQTHHKYIIEMSQTEIRDDNSISEAAATLSRLNNTLSVLRRKEKTNKRRKKWKLKVIPSGVYDVVAFEKNNENKVSYLNYQQ